MNATILGLAIICCFGHPLTEKKTESQSASGEDAAHQVLQHYAGVWDCNFTILPQKEGNEAKSFSGVVEAKWVVGGQFLEQLGRYKLDDASHPFVIKTLMSFDKKRGSFHYVYFDSAGEIRRSQGDWNAESKTMTSKMTDQENESVSTITADFSTKGVERWTIETKNKNGPTTTKIVGTNTRRSER